MSADIDLSELQSTLEYLRYKEATAGSKAKQTDAETLADEADRSIWARIKADRGLR